ncbi:glutactin-like [Rhagoletis pomonella]|uniref:glutactin-like n=1 Tax=Rhagoletis pomonella TaxID=28610 RepID=UPI00177EFA0B|nr:glutactin-like [Rhagoletis pomonella]
MAFLSTRLLSILCLTFIPAGFVLGTKNIASPEVRVNLPGQGVVIGNWNTTQWTGQPYMQFRGIPYAEPPSGEMRFRLSVPRKPWPEPLRTTEYGRICPQLFTYNRLPADKLKGNLEDCLTLNVFTKKLNAKQPVMFYVHGGSLQVGFASDHQPGYLLEEDVVLVVIQYRLGILGFSGTQTEGMPGNLGLLDTILALQWVQKHISAFGGDKTLVTVFGESSGGELGGALLVSPKTPPSTFERLIIQSGSVVDKVAVNQEPREQVERVCQALKCEKCTQLDEMQRCLKQAPVLDLLKAAESERYGLIVGDYYGSIPQHPAKLIEATNRSVPLLTGFTKHDGSLVLAWFYEDFKATHPDMSAVTVGEFATGLMNWMNDTTGLTNNALTRLLFPAELWHSSYHKRALPAYFDLANILFFKSTMIGFTNQLFAKAERAPIYFYTFDYAGEQTNFGFDTGNSQYPFNGGVHHTDELIYLFPMKQLNALDTEMAKKMVAMWVSFAIGGQPKAPGGPPILPMKTLRGPYFHINKEIKNDDDLLKEFTATIDDPENQKLDRPNKSF